MTARDEILGRIRSALVDQPRPAPVARSYRGAGQPAHTPDENPTEDENLDLASALLDLLVDRLVDYKATVLRATPSSAAEVIAAALADRTAKRIVVPEGFPAELLEPIDPASIVRDDPPLSAAELDVTDGVLTTSTVAIAETGTIVLDAGPGQGRRALSLVPDYHLCVVRAADVVRGVPEGVARLLQTSGARPLTWISGPSATSDIELQRVEGVHGPRTLAVVLIT